MFNSFFRFIPGNTNLSDKSREKSLLFVKLSNPPAPSPPTIQLGAEKVSPSWRPPWFFELPLPWEYAFVCGGSHTDTVLLTSTAVQDSSPAPGSGSFHWLEGRYGCFSVSPWGKGSDFIFFRICGTLEFLFSSWSWSSTRELLLHVLFH